MHRLVPKFVAPVLTALGLCAWSGCDYVENFLESSCGTNCSHHHHDAEKTADPAGSDAAGHPRVGPNGGRLIVLGDVDFHAELLIDHAKAEATVRMLDRTGRNPVRVDQTEITLNVRANGRPHQIKLVPVETGDAADRPGSCFQGSNDVLKGDCQLAGRLNVVIRGKPYTGQIAHHEDDHKLIR